MAQAIVSVGNHQLDALETTLDQALQQQPDPKRPSKQDVVIAMLRQPKGATVDEVASTTSASQPTTLDNSSRFIMGDFYTVVS